MKNQNNTTPKLGEGLTNRQVMMISIGGVIGAGLFIGSSAAIAKAGPAVVLSYALTSLVVFLVMRMLGEMAVMQPDTGSFSTYASKAIAPWAGFTIGWLYWWFWVLVIPVEAIAGAEILHAWFPMLPAWLYALLFVVILSLANLFDVKNFGTFEFWFSLIKVVAILMFIGICGLAVFGLWPWADVSGIANLYQNGGFMPFGFGGILAGILITAFSFFGVEILSIAAAEAHNPQEKIRKATNLVIYRIILFFVVSIFLAVSLVDWRASGLKDYGTFQYVLMTLNVPGTKLIMDSVVFVAVASCMNAALYTASRMLFSLGARKDAPAAVTRLTPRGVPRVAVILSCVVGILGCMANYFFPGQVLTFLLSTTGAIALLVYLVIAISQLRLRKRYEAQGVEIPFKMWLFPWLTWLVILMIVSVLGYMFFSPDYSYETLMSLTVTGVVVVCGVFINYKRKKKYALTKQLS
ncbi:amino acid permease [Acinetobacter larvae]|uniref:GABA permease n=1 Tax=Acinetobacter larvae TaxID=1789224 RepID=A0A1B2M0A7_9GAMM|nr:amino acid permease [Acinetobacter larvae]AOA58605.1 GABA permease [Acinetobacter larvae]